MKYRVMLRDPLDKPGDKPADKPSAPAGKGSGQ